jgi:hypothetical protein
MALSVVLCQLSVVRCSLWGKRAFGTREANNGQRTTDKGPLIGLAAGPASVALEPVVAIVMPTLAPCQETGQQVRGDECGSPTLDLPDVGLLVGAAELQTPRIAANDHMTQGHGGKTERIGEPAGKAAMKLERTAAILDAPA